MQEVGYFIEFPKLGIHLKLDPLAFSVGTIRVYWYGIIIALSFLVIIFGVLRNSEKYSIKQDDLIDMMLITTPIGIICARLFYVIVNWKDYSGNPVRIIQIWEGGLAIYGGIIGGIITIYLFCRHRKINTLQLLDHIVVFLVLGQSIGRWGNFVNQELFGPPTTLPWGMTGNIIQRTTSEPVHPLFLYESLWNLAAFFVLLWFRNRKKLNGEVFFLYMIIYGGARLTIDSLRSDLLVGGVNINQVIGGIFVFTFIILFVVKRVSIEKIDEDQAYKPSRYREIIDEMEAETGDFISPGVLDGSAQPGEPSTTNEETVPSEPAAQINYTPESTGLKEPTDS
jgi:phosphatidylglycerol:prolipoprotein diacylglycerol transferase